VVSGYYSLWKNYIFVVSVKQLHVELLILSGEYNFD